MRPRCAPGGYLVGTHLRNLVAFEGLPHTRLTYHRTWETGLRVAIRVTTFSPAFFVRFYIFCSYHSFHS